MWTSVSPSAEAAAEAAKAQAAAAEEAEDEYVRLKVAAALVGWCMLEPIITHFKSV
jgi:hypothetical protein